MPIGIIVWLILIFIIACCQDGFLQCLAIVLGIPTLLFIAYFIYWMYRDDSKDDESKDKVERTTPDRERAIDQWEKKWGRKHPTRK